MLTKLNSIYTVPIGKHLKIATDIFAYSAAEVWNNILNNICNWLWNHICFQTCIFKMLLS